MEILATIWITAAVLNILSILAVVDLKDVAISTTVTAFLLCAFLGPIVQVMQLAGGKK